MRCGGVGTVAELFLMVRWRRRLRGEAGSLLGVGRGRVTWRGVLCCGQHVTAYRGHFLSYETQMARQRRSRCTCSP